MLCVRRVILVLCGDCESGNKTAYDMIKDKIEDGSIDPSLDILSILPDCPHLGKTLKGSIEIENSYLKLNCEAWQSYTIPCTTKKI